MLRLSSNALALRKAVDARAALPAIETQDPPMDWLTRIFHLRGGETSEA
jgi:hypothetical protein